MWKISNLNGNSICVFGHGGSGTRYRYPMNSMHSLNNVLQMGVYGTEMDVQLSSDNQLMLYHPVKLEDETSCDGTIREKKAEDVTSCRYKLPLLSDGTPLISADGFFEQCSDRDNYFFVFDTKVMVDADADFIADFAEALYALIQKYKLEQHCFIESYNITFLQAMRSRNKNLKLFIHADDYKSGLDAAQYVKLYGLTMDRTRISADEIEAAHKNNLRVALFNLETENENLEGIKMNPDFMQSDNCEFLQNALK